MLDNTCMMWYDNNVQYDKREDTEKVITNHDVVIDEISKAIVMWQEIEHATHSMAEYEHSRARISELRNRLETLEKGKIKGED